MDLYPSAWVQPEINLPEGDVDAPSGPSGATGTSEHEPSQGEESVHQLIANETVNSLSSVSSFKTSSSSLTASTASGYHTPPWEVSLTDFRPASNNAVHYDRDIPTQKLVAVIGREFDTPVTIADKLQKQFKASGSVPGEGVPRVKFLGYQVRRKDLLSTRFKMADLQRHDAILFCYNASEARILLTGSDGFYSSLLRQVERTLGPAKAAFALYNYNQLRVLMDPEEAPLLEPFLHERLQSQNALHPYLTGKQVLSWAVAPTQLHLQKLCELTDLEPNPVPQDNCSLL